jgi:hypothetical protein
VATTAWASGTLRGRVVSPTGAPRDAVSVHITDDAGYELETRTDGEGRFDVRGLPVGHYTVSVFGPGLEWVETVDVRVGPDAETVLIIPVREVVGDVFVRRTGSPVIRTASTEGGVVVEVEDRRSLPGRAPLEDLVAWLPGAVPAADDPWRARDPSPRASSAGPPRLEVDGVEATGAVDGWQGLGAPIGSVAAMRAVTAASSVNRPVGVDGSLLLAMQRGGAGLVGDVALGTGGTSLGAAEARRPADRELGLSLRRSVELAVALGGGIEDHRLTWFLALEGRRASDTLSTTNIGAAEWERDVVERARDRRRDRATARLQWLPSSRWRFGLTAGGDRERRDGDVAATLTFDWPGEPPSDAGFDVDADRLLIGVSGSALTPRGDLVELSVGRLEERMKVTPYDLRASVRDQTVDGRWSGGVGSGAVAGGPGFASHRDEARSTSGRMATTWGFGDHELEAGVSVHELEVERRWSRRDPATRCVPVSQGAMGLDPVTGSMRPVQPNCAVNGAPGLELPFDSGERLRLADGTAVLLASGAAGPGSHGRRRETSLWLGDRWTPSPRVTLRAGIRLADLDLEVERPAPSRLDLGLGDRLGWGVGVAWDPEGSGRTRVWAHVGRRRPTVSVDLDAGALFGDPAPRIRLDPPTALDASIGVVTGVREIAPVAVASGLVAPAWDELAVGGEWELFGDLAVGTELVLRRWAREVVRVWLDDVQLQVLAPTGTTVDRHPLTFEPLSRAVVVPDADREEQSVTVSGVKRYRGGWQLATAVTWSRTVGAPAPGRGVDARRDDGPVVTEPFDTAAMTTSAVAAMAERRWQLRMEGSYAWESGPVIGVSGWWMSGSVAPRTGAVSRDLDLDQRVIDGTTRLADPWTVDARLEWPFDLAGGELGVIVGVRNLFDHQAALAVDTRWSVLDEGSAASEPDVQRTRDGWATPRLRQAPRTVWAGVRWSWR